MNYHVEFDISFKRNSYKGLYIALEGVDASGKTTQAEELTKYFEVLGRKVVCTREPRKKGIIGDIVHKVLLGKIKMPSKALQYLFSTERVIHHEELIIPSLKEGKVVITDRCFWSAIVYGILDRMEEEKYSFKDSDLLLISQSILSMYHQFIIPDYTFYLKTSLQTALSRLKLLDKEKEIYEGKEKLEKIIKGYDWLVKQFTKEIMTIDGEKTVEEVTKEIVKRIKI